MCAVGAAGSAGLGASLEKPLETWLLLLRSEELQWWDHELYQIAHDLAPTFPCDKEYLLILRGAEIESITLMTNGVMGILDMHICMGWQEQDTERYLDS